jgi:hypothetical protein
MKNYLQDIFTQLSEFQSNLQIRLFVVGLITCTMTVPHYNGVNESHFVTPICKLSCIASIVQIPFNVTLHP